MDKFSITVAVTGMGKGTGTSFVSKWLDHYLNRKDRTRIFVSRPDRYKILDDPENPGDCDCIIGVIDPLPSMLIRGAERIDEIINKELPVIWLINRDNAGVNRRELNRFLGFRPSFSQEEVPRELMTRAEYNSIELPELVRLEGLEHLAEHIQRTVF